MTTADDLLDRRALRRKVTFWRVASVLAVIAAVGIAVLLSTETETGGDQIARVSIEGLITEDRDLLDLLDRLKDEERVRAVILRIDSPGGTTVGGEAIYEHVRAIAEKKPVAAEVGTLAASAGYMIAAGTDHIVARRTSIVGSIGVLFQYVNAEKLLDTVGVEVNAIKSSPIKAEPSPFGPPPPEATAMIRRLIIDTYDWFRDLVAERRKMSPGEIAAVADASVFSGQDGLDNKLVDAIGGENEVRAWLEGERGVPADLKIVEREPAEDAFGFPFLDEAASAMLGALGLENLGLGRHVDAIKLDGLVSLWQPSN